MNSLAHSGVFWVGLIAGLALLYFLPTMIGIIRKVESLSLPIFLNVLPTGVIFSPHVSQATDLRRLAATVSSTRCTQRCERFWQGRSVPDCSDMPAGRGTQRPLRRQCSSVDNERSQARHIPAGALEEIRRDGVAAGGLATASKAYRNGSNEEVAFREVADPAPLPDQ